MALAKSLVLAANQKAPPATGTFSRRTRFVERIQQQIDLALKFELRALAFNAPGMRAAPPGEGGGGGGGERPSRL